MSAPTPQHRFAFRLGVKTLFKYKAFRAPEQIEQVHQILIGNCVYFARASQLNDQDDLRPLVRIRSLGSEKETRDALVKAAERHWED